MICLVLKAYLFVITKSDRIIELVVYRKVYELSDGCGLGTGWEHVLDGGRDVLHCWRTRRVPRVN